MFESKNSFEHVSHIYLWLSAAQYISFQLKSIFS